jgi:hypothetical protein
LGRRRGWPPCPDSGSIYESGQNLGRVTRGILCITNDSLSLSKKKDMAQVDNLRNGLIEKLLTISNIDYLKALNEIVSSSKLETNKLDLTEEQVLMLKLSDKDIEDGRLISQNQLDKEDLVWLKGL